MSGIEMGVAFLLLIAFIAGVAGGVVIVVSVASRREDRLGSLTGVAPDRTCQGARLLIGADVRGRFRPARPRPDGDGDGTYRGREPDL